MKLFLIENATDKVVNIIKVDPKNLPDVPDGFRYEESAGNIGDVLTGGEWVADTVAEAAAAAELEARRIARIKAEFDRQDSVNKVLLKIGFLQENRIRLLEGQAEVTAAQFRTWVNGQIE